MDNNNIKIGAVCSERLFKKLCARLAPYGIAPLHAVNMEIVPLTFRLESVYIYDWIVFTSPNGVSIFFDRFRPDEINKKTKFAVLGKGTGGALREHSTEPAFLPEIYTAEHLAAGLAGVVCTEDKVLIFRSARGNPVLTEKLKLKNIDITEVKCYDTNGSITGECDLNEPDYMLFFSASGVNAYKNFLSEGSMLEEYVSEGSSEKILHYKYGGCKYKDIRYICIGHETERALKKAGFEPYRTAGVHDVDGIVSEVLKCTDLKCAGLRDSGDSEQMSI